MYFYFTEPWTGPPGNRIICPKCEIHLKSYALLDNHLTEFHNITNEEEYLEFENEGGNYVQRLIFFKTLLNTYVDVLLLFVILEFRAWKLKLEKETQSQYVTIRGLRKRSNYTQREFICHRSYIAKSISTQRKRTLKSLGTNKIGGTCPSRMIVRITDKTVSVNFIRIHIGHCTETIRMRLPSNQRVAIAGKYYT